MLPVPVPLRGRKAEPALESGVRAGIAGQSDSFFGRQHFDPSILDGPARSVFFVPNSRMEHSSAKIGPALGPHFPFDSYVFLPVIFKVELPAVRDHFQWVFFKRSHRIKRGNFARSTNLPVDARYRNPVCGDLPHLE